MMREIPQESRRPAALAPQAREGAAASPSAFLLAASALALSRPGFSGKWGERSVMEAEHVALLAAPFLRAEPGALREAAEAAAALADCCAGTEGPLALLRFEMAVGLACRRALEGVAAAERPEGGPASAAGGSASRGEAREPARQREARG